MTVVSQKPLSEVVAWQQGFECALCMLQEWCWTSSDLLNEDRRTLLRTMKTAALDFAILLRAATLRGEDRMVAKIFRNQVRTQHDHFGFDIAVFKPIFWLYPDIWEPNASFTPCSQLENGVARCHDWFRLACA